MYQSQESAQTPNVTRSVSAAHLQAQTLTMNKAWNIAQTNFNDPVSIVL
jgi:hypothetical protein